MGLSMSTSDRSALSSVSVDTAALLSASRFDSSISRAIATATGAAVQAAAVTRARGR
jgi:hypothetical protein